MYNQGPDRDKVDTSASPPYYPPPDNQIASMNAPGHLAPQSCPQPGGVPYLSAPLHQQPANTISNTNTAVVIQQQPAAIVVQGARGWSSGVCACFDDCGVCKSGGGETGVRERGVRVWDCLLLKDVNK